MLLRLTLLTTLAIACGQIASPTDNAADIPVESTDTRRFGFGLSIPGDLADTGWRAYSVTPSREWIDSYRTMQFRVEVRAGCRA